MRNPLSGLLNAIRRSLVASPSILYFEGKKVEEIGPLLPSRKLVYATATCLLAIVMLSLALVLCIILLGEAPPELISAIVSLASTLVGIYVGRKW
ncbi:MAG TPA: hypothetical protein ENF78_02805 [Candidatus Bathyarchaeota archaeon]|nr:hypothetical protein [Candidatus Bathyarchaeota archaeon]